jgi:lipopolysaccharide transport system ATP-binding protein
MSTVIKVENIGKQYRLGMVGTGTLSHDLNRWWARLRGKEDPYLSLGESNDRTQKGNSDLVWALQDINFEVKQGDVLGIVGRNGAGKSTLLKILSRTTTPTTGEFKVRGRIASLLEVGTGFHPELTGRENVFLNGAIMGMTKAEITKKFDEIIDFSGVERYIDTPVKRYSSGMYVRLAFAVAAHLEPEILIVDEVLAVGDAEFQKKCLGKMKDVSGEGRTVLFVSHNISAIQNLCKTALYLKNGRLIEEGACDDVLAKYLTAQKTLTRDLNERNNESVSVNSIELFTDAKISKHIFSIHENINLVIGLQNNTAEKISFDILFSLYNQKQELLCQFSTMFNGETITLESKEKTERMIQMLNIPLLPGSYSVNIALIQGNITHHKVLHKIENFDLFDIEGGDPFNNGILPKYGTLLIDSKWGKQ